MKPLLSVIIPSYNNEKYMKECLDSVLNQSFTDFEIVICDDHSTDGTYDILMQYQRTHGNITVIRNERNMGVTPSRHSAILQCQGKYITTLDHDDVYLSKDKLLSEFSLVSLFKETQQKEICAFSDIVLINQNSAQLKSQWDSSMTREGNIFKEIITRSGMIPRDFLFLREDYIKIGGFDPKLKLYEDWDLKIRLAYIREFYFTGQVGTGYRRMNAGFSNTFSMPQHVAHMKTVFRKNARLIPQNEAADYRTAFQSFLEGKRKTALKPLINQFDLHLQNRKILNACLVFARIIRLKLINTRV